MSIRTRFAPSPTGLLHVGNARAALFCFLFAKKHDGQFVLRLDDTDRERSTQAFADAIQADLDWLGLKWDETARQSDRFERYDGVFETLVAQGHVYACYETPEELSANANASLHGANRLFMTAQVWLCRLMRKPLWRPKAGRRIGGLNFRAIRSLGAISCAESRKSTPPACQTRLSAAPMAVGSTRCPVWWMIWI